MTGFRGVQSLLDLQPTVAAILMYKTETVKNFKLDSHFPVKKMSRTACSVNLEYYYVLWDMR